MTRQLFEESTESRFAIQVRLHRGVSPADEAGFQHRTEDWLARHELRADGSQTTFVILADRELSPEDQANAMLSMLDDPAVRQARVGPIVKLGDELTAQVSGRVWVEADRLDPLVHAARTLYEAGRLNGHGFLDALGYYVYRPAEHGDRLAEDQS